MSFFMWLVFVTVVVLAFQLTVEYYVPEELTLDGARIDPKVEVFWDEVLMVAFYSRVGCMAVWVFYAIFGQMFGLNFPGTC